MTFDILLMTQIMKYSVHAEKNPGISDTTDVCVELPWYQLYIRF